MKILAFETTDAVASVALYRDGETDLVLLSTEKRHAESVLPAAEELLRRFGLVTADLDAFAVDVGPGSFTGVRIGVCLANALGLAHGKPVIAVNALEALAEPLLGTEETVCALIDARNGNGYGAAYRAGNCIEPPCACEIEPFLERMPKGCRLTGTATEDGAMPKADAAARIAAKRAGEKQVSPVYLKPSQAERMQS